MRSVSTILLRAAEETKSPANNLISNHFWYTDIDKQIFLVSMRHILKPLLATMSVSGYLHPVRLIIVRWYILKSYRETETKVIIRREGLFPSIKQ